MKPILHFVWTVLVMVSMTRQPAFGRPYRLESVDLKQRVIWGATCRLPDGRGLAFGGQDAAQP